LVSRRLPTRTSLHLLLPTVKEWTGVSFLRGTSVILRHPPARRSTRPLPQVDASLFAIWTAFHFSLRTSPSASLPPPCRPASPFFPTQTLEAPLLWCRYRLPSPPVQVSSFPPALVLQLVSSEISSFITIPLVLPVLFLFSLYFFVGPTS